MTAKPKRNLGQSFGLLGRGARRVVEAASKSGPNGRVSNFLDEVLAIASEAAMYVATPRLVRDSAKGIAAEIFAAAPAIEQHLLNTPHFGILEQLVPFKSRRYDYVAFQLKLAMGLKKNIPGLGLSAELKVGPRDLSGLELVQLWAILTSAGHLFGTFATERALSYRLQADGAALDEFLKPLPPGLAVAARQKITGGGMNEFVNVLAAWRIAQEPLPQDMRETCVAAMAMYLRPPADARERRLLALHRRVRQAAYQRLQAVSRLPARNRDHSLFVGFVSIGASIDDFFERDGIGFDPSVDEATPMSHLVQAVDEFQSRSFFTSTEANRLVLEHLRDFKHWWQACADSERPVTDRVISLRSRPTDWPRPDRGRSPVAKAAVRLDLPRKGSWFTTVQSWLGDRSIWTDSNFLLTEIAGKNVDVCDIFTATRLTVREREHVARMLCTASRDSDLECARSVARFALLLLGYALRPNIRPLLQPVPTDTGHGLATIAGSFSELSKKIEHYARTCDVDRARELRASLAALTERRPADEGIWLAFLGRLLLTKADDEREASIQELDAVFVRLTRETEEWNAFEHKVTKQGGGEKQLAKLKDHLAGKISGSGIERAHGKIAWIAFGPH